ncbi:acyltransferase [Coprococcus eutactus]|jgi:acyltransferase|uniref:Acyltransferase n=1 Tax=Coprococcus hominis (ex Liu et al. 2022) TaxID=2763039 RepID=A0A8I0ADY5_9FIRM|nr:MULTISPECIES: acyltransferase [Clostridia]MBC5661289.1 acyltransferase [Coprococcus hominis (ex Liu et al. 2022)]MCB5505174.1 acyltransferase [Coprococcus eutactus]NSC96975.1 acyltransferase [Coprococcus eutactus]NSD36006.1 acyltransferase [Coprococcus eutactus]RGG35586.1 acyltransferase [Clostridium sp. AF23-6LB]
MERKDWIDQLRGFAFFIVVLCHASVLGVISHVGAAFHMPLFFMISGLLFYPEKVLERSLISQVGHKFQSIIIPYFWVVFSLFPIWVLNYRVLRKGKANYWHTLIGNLVSQDKIYPATVNPVWFLGALFFAYLYILIIVKITGRQRWLRLLMAFGIMALGFYFSDKQLPYHVNTGMVGAGYIYTGYLVRRYILEKNVLRNYKNLVIVILTTIGFVSAFSNKTVFMVYGQYYSIPLFVTSSLTFSIALILLFSEFSKDKVLAFMGRNTLFALGAHIALIRICQAIWADKLSSSFIKMFMVFGVEALLLGIAYVMNRWWPYMNGKYTANTNSKKAFIFRMIMVCWCMIVPVWMSVVRWLTDEKGRSFIFTVLFTILIGGLFTIITSKYVKWIYLEKKQV